jgi:hypothetical protein
MIFAQGFQADVPSFQDDGRNNHFLELGHFRGPGHFRGHGHGILLRHAKTASAKLAISCGSRE